MNRSKRHGQENHRLHQIAGAGGSGESLAADRTRARPARPRHHGVLQSLQRPDPEDGEGIADPGRDHGLWGPLLQLRDEDAAGVLFHQEGGEARKRLEDPGPREGRHRDQGAGQGDRRAEDEGLELRHDRGRHAHGRRLRPLDGHRGQRVTAMTNLGKRTITAREGVDRSKLYPLEEAVKMVKDRAKAKFDETIEVAMNLGVDPRHADQMVRGVVSLPNGSGRSVRVGVFARGAKADEARAAGADVVGAEDLVEKVQGGTIDFDRCIATPDLMPLVGRLGKVLGPRGLMPNPKVGTVQAGVGKASFSADQLVQNIKAFADAVQKAKPAGAKGTFINRVAVSSTMGPGVKVEPSSLFAAPTT